MKTVLITGATSGLGLMLSRYFNNKNFELILTGRDKKKINLLKKELLEKNKPNCFAKDFSKKKDFDSFLKLLGKQKKIDVVIHCLGGGFGMHNPIIDNKDLNFLFNINVFTALSINKVILDKKIYSRSLRIIHIGSVASVESTASVGYSMVKASLIAYTKNLAKVLINKNIFIHCLLLGAFEYENNAFERLKKRNKKIYEQFIKKKLPMKKIANAENFLGLFKLLISSDGDSLSGSSIVADYSETNSYRI